MNHYTKFTLNELSIIIIIQSITLLLSYIVFTNSYFAFQIGILLILFSSLTIATILRMQSVSSHVDSEVFYALFQQSRDAVTLSSINDEYIAANTAALDMFGYVEDEIIGKTWHQFIVPEQHEAGSLVAEQVVSGEKLPIYERTAIHKNGNQFPIEVSIDLIKDSDDNPLFIQSVIRDVTERKEAESKLLEERQLLRTIINAIPDDVYVKNLDSHFILVNDAIEKKFGNSLIGKSDQNLDNQQTADEYRAEELEIMKSGKPLLRELRYISSEESLTEEEAWFEVSKVPLYNSIGKIVGIVGVNHDVTDVHQMQAKLKQERNLLRTVIDNIPASIFAKDLESRLILVNQPLQDIFETELLGKTDHELMNDNQATEFLLEEKSIIKTGKALLNVERFISKKDSGRKQDTWLNISKLPLRNDLDEIVGIVGISQDITPNKQQQLQLIDSQERFNKAFHMNPVAIAINHVRDGRFVDVNESFERLSGFNRSELINAKHIPNTWLNETERTIAMESFEKNGYLQQTELHFVCKDGAVRIVNASWSKIELDNEPHILSMLLNITERRKAEKSVQESEERYKKVSELISDYAFSYIVEPDRTLVPDWMTINSFERMFGYKWEPEKLTYNIYHPDDIDRVRSDVQRVIDGNSITAEYRVVTKEGNVRWVEISRQPIWDHKANRVVQLLGAAKDVTEFRETWDELQSAQHLLETIFATIPDAINIFDVVGNKRLYGNKSITQDFGYTINEIIAMGAQLVENLIHPDDLQKYRLHQQQVLQTKDGEVIELEVRMKHKLTGWRWVYSRYTIFRRDNNGIPIEILGIAQDITERKLAEEKLRLSEERYRGISEIMLDTAFSIVYNPETDKYESEWIIGSLPELTGYTYDEFYNTIGTANICHPDDYPKLVADAEATLRGEQTDGEYRLYTKSGEIIWLYIRRVPDFNDNHERINRYYGVTQNITEKKRAEAILRDSEERYRTLFEQSNDAILVFDMEPKVTLANSRTSDLFGVSSEEILGQGITAFVVEEEKLDSHKRWQEILSTNQTSTYKRTGRKADGTIIHTEISARAIRDPDDNPIYVQVILRDITDRYKAEQALQKEQALLRTIIDNIPDIIYMKDRDSRFIVVNEKLQWYWGNTNLIGKTDIELVPSNESEANMREEQELMQTGVPILNRELYVESTLQTPDQPIWLEVSKIPLKDEVGNIIGLVGINRDVTSQKIAERELIERQRLIQGILDTIPDIVYIFDLVDNKNIFQNRNIGEDLGYSATEIEVLGDNLIQELTHEDDLIRLTEHRNKIARLKDKQIVTREYRIQTQSGGWRWIHTRDVVFKRDRSGTPTQIIGIAQDVTESKLATEFLEDLVQELETKNAELERFTYTVSHDLKSPLITIKSFIELLKMDMKTGDEILIEKDLNFIETAANQMEKLLEDLLELSRIGRIINPPEVIDLNELVLEAITLVQGQIDARNVQVNLNKGLPHVFADRLRLVEVYQNLIGNAVKYMGAQPNPQIWIGAKLDKNQVICYVQDNGIGIAPQYHDKVFGLFERLDNTQSGTGIGLALVKRIIELHHGQIWIESDGNNQGSIFRFSLPANY